jgi:phage recombination protein Bet
MNEIAPWLEPTVEQIAVIQETICKGATPEERDLFFFDCRRNGVHPMDRLIHFTKRKSKNADGTWGSKYTPITSIDFLRMRAEGSGEYGGQDDAAFAGDPKKPGFKATVTVYRFLNGCRVPIPASARWEEYAPDGEQFGLWSKMPHLMLAKCAEALALRKAFPQQLHGLYTHEEMAQADNKSRGASTPEMKGATVTEHLKNLPLVETEPEQAPLPSGEPDEITTLINRLLATKYGRPVLNGILSNYGLTHKDERPPTPEARHTMREQLREEVDRAEKAK